MGVAEFEGALCRNQKRHQLQRTLLRPLPPRRKRRTRKIRRNPKRRNQLKFTLTLLYNLNLLTKSNQPSSLPSTNVCSDAKPPRAKLRYYKNIGLGYKTPKAAINGKYIDKKCPFTSDVSIRGRILRGQVVSVKMNRTIIVRRDYLHYYPKYRRYEKRHKNIPAHLSPAFRVKEGDVVTLGQCRPLSKTIRFNVIKVEPQNSLSPRRRDSEFFR